METPGWVSSSPSLLTLPHPQVGKDFAPSFPHRPAFFPCHYHSVKQRGQSGSIWITLTIAYYLGHYCPHSPPPAPTAAVAGPLGAQPPCLLLPRPLVILGGQGTGWSPSPFLGLLAELCFFLTWLPVNDSFPQFNENQVFRRRWFREVPGLTQGEVDVRSRCTCGPQH